MSYDLIAPFYQFLSQLVFGKAQLKSEVDAILYLPHASILIVGGGDGKALESISKNHEIDFIDSSSEMIKIAKKRATKNVNFFVVDFLCFQTEKKYDHIILPFLLDNFTSQQTIHALQKVKTLLKPQGYVTIIDFAEKRNLWQNLLLKTMYLFFRIVAQLKVETLPPIQDIAEQNGFYLVEKSKYYSGFIERKVYKPYE